VRVVVTFVPLKLFIPSRFRSKKNVQGVINACQMPGKDMEQFRVNVIHFENELDAVLENLLKFFRHAYL
jgi:hypothetical protein